MGWGYDRPLDRPAKLWCRSCETWRKLDGVYKGSVSSCCCSDCSVAGTMVWKWGEDLSDYRKPGRKPPHCGNPTCEGFCADPLCMPPAQPEPEPPRDAVGVIGAVAMLALSALAGGALVWFLK